MERLLQILRAVGEDTRLRIAVLSAHSDLTVSELTDILGQSQPRISRHLKLLVEAGVLERSREGSWAYFHLARGGKAERLLGTLIDEVPLEDPVFSLDMARLEEIMAARAERAQAFFRENAKSWDRIRSLYVDEAEVEEAIVASLPEGPIGKHLDIGTGTGRILEICAEKVEQGIGIDLSPAMLAIARSRLEQAGLRQCQVRHGDMYRLPFGAESFGLITLHHVLHYAEKPETAVREAARVTQPGGEVVIVDFESHEMTQLHEEHAHRWLGFDQDKVNEWLADAGLQTAKPQRLEGGPLAVLIWHGHRKAAA